MPATVAEKLEHSLHVQMREITFWFFMKMVIGNSNLPLASSVLSIINTFCYLHRHVVAVELMQPLNVVMSNMKKKVRNLKPAAKLLIKMTPKAIVKKVVETIEDVPLHFLKFLANNVLLQLLTDELSEVFDRVCAEGMARHAVEVLDQLVASLIPTWNALSFAAGQPKKCKRLGAIVQSKACEQYKNRILREVANPSRVVAHG